MAMTTAQARRILLAKAKYKKAYEKGDKKGMAAAHEMADTARGYKTITTTISGGRKTQTKVADIPKVKKVDAAAKAAAKAQSIKPSTKKIQALADSQKPAVKKVETVVKKPILKNESYISKSNQNIKENVGNLVKNFKEGTLFDAETNKENAQHFLDYQKDTTQNTDWGRFLGGVRRSLPYKGTESAVLGKDVSNALDNSAAAKVGTAAGVMAQFAAPYAVAGKAISGATKAIPVVNKMGKLGQGIAGSVGADLALGLPINVAQAYGVQELKGTDALKNIALNTGLDVVTGGVMEAIPYAYKGIKGIKNADSALKQADVQQVPVQTVENAPVRPVDEVKSVQQANVPQAVNVAEKADIPKVAKNDSTPTFLHATNKEFDTFKPAGDGLIYFSEKVNGKKTKADAIYSAPTNHRMIEAKIDESRVKEFDPFVDPEARVIAEKYGLPTDRSYVKWDDVSPMSLEAINKGYNSFNILEPSGEYSRAISDPSIINISNDIRKSNAPAQGSVLPVRESLPTSQASIPKADSVAQTGLKDLGADVYKGGKTTDELVKEYGAIPKGEQPRAREIDVPKATEYGDVQQHARTLQESAIVDDTLYKDIEESVKEGTFTKLLKGNKTAVDDANYTLTNDGLDASLNKFNSVIEAEKAPTSYDIALGNRVLQELQKAGRYDEALHVAVGLSETLSETGRTLQAARIAKRLSPEGRLMIVARAAKKLTDKTKVKVNLSEKTLKDISEAVTEADIAKANQTAAIEMWNQIPATWTEKVNSWRYTAMLFNPKTHVRNIVGNALFVPAREFKNLLGSVIEKPLVKVGDRTKAVINPKTDKALLEFASTDFDVVKGVLKNEGKYDETLRPLEAKVFNNKAIEKIGKANMKAMDAEDTWFMRFAYKGSLAQYMKANKLTAADMVGETLDKARNYAMNEALKATYRDVNSLSNALARGKRTLTEGRANSPLGSLGKKAIGIMAEGAIPFTKTPLNIIKRGVAYSPANVIRGLSNMALNVKSGKVMATEAIDQLASGLSGSSLLALGMYLGHNEIVKGKDGEYGDKSYAYNQMLGSQNYSLNIDGNSYTLDWAAPLSMPFFVGVELAKGVGDGLDLKNLIDATTKISDPMINLSMLKGINDIVTNNFEGIGQSALELGIGYVGQFNPTLFGQVARTVDSTRRSTTSTDEASNIRPLEKFARKQVAKIPFASKTLQPYVDLWGREQKNAGVIENFLSPGYFQSENVTDVDKEILTLSKELDEATVKDIVPASRAIQYTIESASVPYRLSESELTAFQKVSGQESYKGLEALFKTDQYKSLDATGKAEAIKSVYAEAYGKAKYSYFESKGMPVTLALDKSYQEKFATLKGVSDKDYYAAVKATQSAGSRDIEKAAAIQATVKNAPDALYASFGISANTVNNAKTLTGVGLDLNSYQTAIEKANTNGNSYISKDEATAYLNSTGYTREQKRALIKAMVPSLKNIPY